MKHTLNNYEYCKPCPDMGSGQFRNVNSIRNLNDDCFMSQPKLLILMKCVRLSKYLKLLNLSCPEAYRHETERELYRRM